MTAKAVRTLKSAQDAAGRSRSSPALRLLRHFLRLSRSPHSLPFWPPYCRVELIDIAEREEKQVLETKRNEKEKQSVLALWGNFSHYETVRLHPCAVHWVPIWLHETQNNDVATLLSRFIFQPYVSKLSGYPGLSEIISGH